MKIKILSILLLFIFIFLLNLFNQFLVSKIYNLKYSSLLSTRDNWYGMCNDIVDFNIKDLNQIIIGDSHVYSGINLELINSKKNDLTLICSLPSISFANNIKMLDKLENKYNLKKIYVGLSPFQFLIVDDEKERQRSRQFTRVIEKNLYSFQFHSIKKVLQHTIQPISEKEIALEQLDFLKDKNRDFFNGFDRSLNYQIDNVLTKRYNTFRMNEKNNIKYIRNLCEKYKNKRDKIIFLDIPIPHFFNENFVFTKNYINYINEIENCFKIIKSNEVEELKKKKYYFDRYARFKKNKQNEDFLNTRVYDISHLNYVGAYLYTDFIFNNFKKNIN